jgi:purine nucleosidase
MFMVEKVLLDTDIGSDIDDAVCLAYLLANPECDLLGITTVSGEPVQRARLASAICQAAGMEEIPVLPGEGLPLRVEPRQPHAQQAAVLPTWRHKAEFPPDKAIDFMAEAITASPGEVTLLAIGPMTNIALLFRRHPKTARLVKGVSLMIGRYGPTQIGSRPAEWNAYCDPHAAAEVFEARPNRLFAVGLDVTTQVRMEAAEVRRRFQRGILRPVLDMAEVWFAEREQITFHDPLAAVTIFEPNVCEFVAGEVSVLTAHGPEQGSTRWRVDQKGPHNVGSAVTPARFFSRYFEVFSN